MKNLSVIFSDSIKYVVTKEGQIVSKISGSRLWFISAQLRGLSVLGFIRNFRFNNNH